jgi:MerR family transcriptional regulator, light-induced transcriptional regulator
VTHTWRRCWRRTHRELRWRVIDLGAGTPTNDLVHLVAQVRPELVCLSTTLTSNLGHAEDAITALRGLDPPPLIAVGGHAYETNDQLATTLGADIHAGDAAAFLEILRARIPASADHETARGTSV